MLSNGNSIKPFTDLRHRVYRWVSRFHGDRALLPRQRIREYKRARSLKSGAVASCSHRKHTYIQLMDVPLLELKAKLYKVLRAKMFFFQVDLFCAFNTNNIKV